jgi:hypothetical protein
MAHELTRTYESELEPHAFAERLRNGLRQRYGQRLVVEVSDTEFSVRRNFTRQFSVYGTITIAGDKTVIRASFMNAVQTMLLFFFITGMAVSWPLVDSLVKGYYALPFLMLALCWFGGCWYWFWRQISTGIEVLNDVEEVILGDD